MTQANKQEQTSDDAEHGRPVVLLVDDQAMVAEGIRRMLASEGDIDFHYCSNPKEALETASRIRATTILQDLVMPDVDGMTLVRFYRANPATKDIPVIVLSTKEDPATKSDAFSSGANDYLVKLPDKIELIARIRAHSKSYLAQQERDAAYQALRELQRRLENSNDQLARSNLELQRISSLDGLTGIANRRQFDETLEREWRRLLRSEKSLALILIDIDHFKLYNDNYGHQAGDDCLKIVASALSACLSRPGDLVARYGGEEFVMVLPATDINGARIVAEKAQAAIDELAVAHAAAEGTHIVTLSIGVAATMPVDDDGACKLLSAADAALYRAKENGRHRIELADSD